MPSLRDIQLTELEILMYVHKVCLENNIDYAIACGSMLGAIRHKGFIPWDDDLDIYMSYENYKKFEKVFSDNRYFLQNENTDPQMPFIMYKVRKNNTVMPEKTLEKLNIHQGVWVDIFVYFNAGRTTVAKKMQCALSYLLRTIRCRSLNKGTSKENLIQKLLNYMPERFALSVDHFVFSLMRALGSNKSNEYYIAVNNVYERMFYPKNVIDGQDIYEFEGERVKGLKAWNEYLTYEYGSDFMTPKRYDSHLQDFDSVIL